MKLDDFFAQDTNEHSKARNPSVKCNAIYKTKHNLNCYLTASQAIEYARHLLEKAQVIMDHKLEDAVVQVWNQGENNEKLYFGLTKARKGSRRKKPQVA